MKHKHIIWSNIDLNIEDWRNDILEDDPNLSDDEIYYRMIEVNNIYLDDERDNLNITIPTEIIAIGDLGRWNGRCQGYKIIGNNINECLYSDNDYTEWYVDGRGDFRCTDIHHDGTNYYLYRAFKPNISEIQKGNFLDKVYNGCVTRRDITRYTRSLGKEISNVYGWR